MWSSETPPYNNDVYLDFVTLAHQLSSQYTCMITPAKWQAKGGEKNEKFRRDIVPYMSHIVYYPNCSDVFEINDCSGISYCLIDKDIHDKKEIRNLCKHNSNLDSLEFRTLNPSDRLLNIGDRLSKKVGQQPKLKFSDKMYRYCIYINTQVNPARGLENVYQALGMVSYSTGKAQILGKYFITDKSKNENPSSGTVTLVFSSDSLHECESFLSYVYSKLVRILIWSSISTTTIINDQTWRFVPDPGPFDHIFTDEELYQKYSLTPEEIAIIESVIKERKPRD